MVMADRDETWCVSLCSSLDSLRQNSAFLDVIISADDGRILRAHTCVLAAASSVLKTELSAHCHQLHIPGISGQTWEAVLHFIYTGEIQVTKAQEVANLLKACHRLGLAKLANMCGECGHDDKTGASASSKHFQIPIMTEELATSFSSGVDGDETRQADSIHKDPDIPQQCVTLYTETGPLQEDVQIAVVDIHSQTHNSKSAGIQLDSLDIQALMTEEIQLDSGTVELDANAMVEEVSLGMFLKKEVLDIDGQAQDNTGQIPAVGGELDSSNDDKGHVRKTLAQKGRKRRGKYKGGAKDYNCEVCGKVFSHLSRLKFHSNIHTGERPYACGQCGMTFNHSSNLARHERTHTGIRPHACPECGREFQRASDMAVHMQRVHCLEKPFACELCPKEFSMESDLKSHMYQHMDVKPFKCPHCDKSFGKMVNLVTHERRHTGERPFACQVCAMTFKDSSNLARHRRIHTGIKPFECSICGKAFLRKADLIGHQRIHTEEKPFVCSICGKAFTFRTSLDMHARLHTGEKPYMCAVCGKTFSRNCNLLDHHMTHTGDKPFQCCTCGRNFSTKKKLASHERVHSESKPFECHFCGKRYRWASVLKKHVIQCSS